MTTLSEIERQAYLKKIRTWHEQRGMDIEHQILTEPVMRYIERLEAERETSKRDTWGKVIKMIQDEPIFPPARSPPPRRRSRMPCTARRCKRSISRSSTTLRRGP